MRLRYGRSYALKTLILPTIVYVSIASIVLYVMWPYIYYAKNETIIMIGLFALWRYGWLVLNATRAFIYGRFAYPLLQKKIKKLDENIKYPEHIYFLIPSYKEEDWVSIETFKSIFNELLTIPSHATIIVATSGDPKEDSIIQDLYQGHMVRDKVTLVFQHQKEGKRIAMGHGLRSISRRYLKNDADIHSVTFFMDGDSYLEKGFFQKVLPHFAIDSKLGAITTNEAAFIHTNSNWYKDWFNLKFGQRHLLFQSHSLSKKVLTLTGRLSAYRTRLVIQDDFINTLENDIITTVMHGKFRFLMGDDKTTWFMLLKKGWNMRYLPDALCYSLESRDADFIALSRSLPYRWYGNTLRNSNRALALGPKHIGFFIWWAILDQRISMWTSLVGLSGAIILGLFKAFYYFLFYISWVLFVRSMQIAALAYNGHLVSLRTLPLMLYGQWIGSTVKIKALFNLSDQKWSKGNETQDSDDSVARVKHPLRDVMPDAMMLGSYLLFIYILLLSHEALAFPDIDLIETKPQSSQNNYEYKALEYGVIPDDGKDDAKAINTLLQQCDPKRLCQIVLPKGRIDLYESITIRRDHVILEGAGENLTQIISHLKTEDIAAIYIKGERGKKVGTLKAPIEYNDSIIEAQLSIKEPNWLLIRTPNDAQFFNQIHSQVWRKQYPYLRQQIVHVSHYRHHANLLMTAHAISTAFPRKNSEIWELDMIEDIELRHFTIAHNIPGAHIQDVQYKYENLYNDHRVDMIRFEYAANVKAHNLKILNSGRHPIMMEYVFHADLSHLYINGAWNKGKKGNGYVRISRTFNSILHHSTIKNIRHITLQWSSADNLLQYLELQNADINFHGGYSHDNTVKNISIQSSPEHLWKPITYTPINAHYAPPDGPRNQVMHIQEGR
ncbi:MAG: glycosyltransferase [Campylobacterota bacterium]|nr:glycosyltransferase [Campylobacterota bacterium]